MITTWSQYTGAGQADGGGRLVMDYLTAQEVRKDIAGSTILLHRDPAPQTLIGHADLVAGLIASLPFKHRYSAVTLSFSLADIDVTRFNSGDELLRQRVGKILALFLDCAFVGVMPGQRPPVLANTHTHTGRLEINIVIPRAIRRGDGRTMAFNPHPPGRVSRFLWDSFTDCVNWCFGFADPRGPEHMRLVALPDQRLKRAAEARRNGVRIPWDPRATITSLALACHDAGEADNRADLLAGIEPELKEHGIAVLAQSHHTVTFSGPNGERWRLRGHLFSAGFDELNPLYDLSLPEYAELRASRLRRAPDQLRYALGRRAEFHAYRYGGRAPIVDPVQMLRNGPDLLPPGDPVARPGRVPSPIMARLVKLASGVFAALATRLASALAVHRIAYWNLKPLAQVHQQLEQMNDRYAGPERVDCREPQTDRSDRASADSPRPRARTGDRRAPGEFSRRTDGYPDADAARRGYDGAGAGAQHGGQGRRDPAGAPVEPDPGRSRDAQVLARCAPAGSHAEFLRELRDAALSAGMAEVTLRLTRAGTVMIRAKGIRVHCSRTSVHKLWAEDHLGLDRIVNMSRLAGLQPPPQDFDDIGGDLQM